MQLFLNFLCFFISSFLLLFLNLFSFFPFIFLFFLFQTDFSDFFHNVTFCPAENKNKLEESELLKCFCCVNGSIEAKHTTNVLPFELMSVNI